MAQALRRFRPDDAAEAIRRICRAVPVDGELYVGIDPGVCGAIAFLPTRTDEPPIAIDMPILQSQVRSTKKGKRKMVTRTIFNHHEIVRLLDPIIDDDRNLLRRTIVALERGQPRPGDPVRTGFLIGVGYGMWHLYFATFAFVVEEAMPSVWKVRMGLSKQEKDASRALALRLFPGAARYLACKGDHDRAEALLVAEYVRRQRAGVPA